MSRKCSGEVHPRPSPVVLDFDIGICLGFSAWNLEFGIRGGASFVFVKHRFPRHCEEPQATWQSRWGNEIAALRSQ
jgi:hypothetical protein